MEIRLDQQQINALIGLSTSYMVYGTANVMRNLYSHWFLSAEKLARLSVLNLAGSLNGYSLGLGKFPFDSDQIMKNKCFHVQMYKSE